MTDIIKTVLNGSKHRGKQQKLWDTRSSVAAARNRKCVTMRKLTSRTLWPTFQSCIFQSLATCLDSSWVQIVLSLYTYLPALPTSTQDTTFLFHQSFLDVMFWLFYVFVKLWRRCLTPSGCLTPPYLTYQLRHCIKGPQNFWGTPLSDPNAKRRYTTDYY